MRKFLHVFKNIFVRLVGYIEVVFSYFIVQLVINSGGADWYVALYIIPGFILWKNLKLEFFILKGKKTIKEDALNSRVQGFEGGQGRGKTSLMLYSASILKRPVYSNLPFKIKGKYSNLLTNDIINLKTRVKEKSILIFDEISLYYHNLSHTNNYDFELLMQLCRHFFDGNIFTASVSMGRIPKQLEEKHVLFKKLLGQTTVYNSFIIAPLIGILGLNKKLGLKFGIRKWTYQTFEEIGHASYVYDLSTDNADTKNKKFANLVDIYAFNQSLAFEYEDRFLKKLYYQISDDKDLAYDSLVFDFAKLKDTGYEKLCEYFDSKLKSKLEPGEVVPGEPVQKKKQEIAKAPGQEKK